MENLKELYEKALTIRMVEQKISDIYHEQEMRCPTHLCLGEEGIAAGLCHNLRKDDWVYAYFRSHGWYLAKGGSLQGIFSELYGKPDGCCFGFGGSPHLIDLENGLQGTSAIVAGSLPHAVGAAFAFKSKGLDSVVVAACGDGATEEGVFHESLMFAKLRELPVIFVCENNRLATNSRLEERQHPGVKIHKRAEGLGVESFHVDGNNAIEVAEHAKRAVEKARQGGGPTFLECETFRILEHVGPNKDYSMRHRDEKEVQEWSKRDPIDFLESKLDQGYVQEKREKLTAEIEAAIAHAKSEEYPSTLQPLGELQ